MAEVFGIVTGSIGIAAAFSTCVDCFNYVQLGRRFGRDYQTNALCLELIKLRLSRWGEAVNVHEDPMLGNPRANPDELEAARNTLVQILVLLEDSQKASDAFKSTAKVGDLLEYTSSDMAPSLLNLKNRVREIAKKRQKNASLLKVTNWAIYDGTAFEKLQSDITRLIDGLETLFSASTAQQMLIRQDIETATDKDHKETDLAILKDLAGGVDKLLQTTATTALHSQNTLKDSTTTGQAKVLVGNTWSKIWARMDLSGIPKSTNAADHVTTDQNGKLQVGDRFEEKDFFD